MTASGKWIYDFSDAFPFENDQIARATLGGKGLSLARMTAQGFPVPPGFTLSTACCRWYLENHGTWPDALGEDLSQAIKRLERDSGRRFGAAPQPLLVSVRSGAPVSMPGMMDTILNCGIHPGLEETAEDPLSFRRIYVAFVLSFAKSTAAIDVKDFVARGCKAPSSVRDRADIEQYLNTYTDITGRDFPTDPWSALTASINAVFNSWTSERALSYRDRNAHKENTGTAVNIQMMFPSVVSGVVFTRPPASPDADRIIIESSLGLGESIVSGNADPDRFVIARSRFQVLERHIGRKEAVVAALGSGRPPPAAEPSLDPDRLRELARLSLAVESHFGFPLDIEFGYDGTRLALLQCRRIRGMALAAETTSAQAAERNRLRDLAGDQQRIWVAHNLSETLRNPTPLTWDIVRYFMSGAGGMGAMYRRLGFGVPDAEEAEFLELIGGKIYADPEKIVDLLWRGMPVSCDIEALKADSSRVDNPPVVLNPDKADPALLLRLPALLWHSVASAMRIRRLKQDIHDRFENQALPPFLDYVADERQRDLAALSLADLRHVLRDRRQRVLRDFGADALAIGFLGAMSMNDLTGALQRLLGRSQGQAMAQQLTRSIHSISAMQYALLTTVTAGEASKAEFLEQFGHRRPGEMELAVPRWRDDIAALDRMLDSLSATGMPAATQPGGGDPAEEARRNLPNLLAGEGASSLLDEVNRRLDVTCRLLPYRENGKHYLMLGYALLRDAITEIGRRLQVNENVFYLTWQELMAAPSTAELQEQVKRRKRRWRACRNIYVPPVVDSNDLDAIGRRPVVKDGHNLIATPISPGTACARARVLLDPQDKVPIPGQFIIVCPSTDPGWTPLLSNAAGLVVEKGGMLSHGALIARELGVPAVVLPDATKRIASGAMVTINGSTGAVGIEKSRAGT